jgi:dTDP-4-amino-4,6-dideoxygalactose transaminase
MSTDMTPVLQTSPLGVYLSLKDAIDEAVAAVLGSGQYILGPQTTAFEGEFAACVGTRQAVGVASGTDALVLALKAVGVGPGLAVVAPSHTATATVAAIELAGGLPVLIDIAPGGYTLDPDELERVIADPPAPLGAILAVHLYGHPADMDRVLALAGEAGLPVVEDACQAHGAQWNGRRVGGIGAVGAFSFYPTKNLPAFGDGGMVVTDDETIAERVRALRQYGWRERYVSDFPGFNSRLDELQAAILRVGLPRLDAWNRRRREVAQAYDRALAGAGLTLPETDPRATHVYHQYVIQCDDRDGLRRRLAEQGVGTAIHYPAPVHRQPAYAGRVPTGPSGLGQTDRAADRILSLPMHPTLTDAEVERVVLAINGAG